MLFDMVLADRSCKRFPRRHLCHMLLVSALLSACLSLSVPRPTNLVMEAPNPIITKLTVNTQVSYPYWPAKDANIYCTGVERRRWRPCCRCRSYSSISPGGCEDIDPPNTKLSDGVGRVIMRIMHIIFYWEVHSLKRRFFMLPWRIFNMHGTFSLYTLKVPKGVFTVMPQKNHFGSPKNLSVKNYYKNLLSVKKILIINN